MLSWSGNNKHLFLADATEDRMTLETGSLSNAESLQKLMYELSTCVNTGHFFHILAALRATSLGTPRSDFAEWRGVHVLACANLVYVKTEG
uniref:Ras-GEF domain-containing protein n=1 Tax=Ascaris lumbricoides TaxID=6252 RepID=A0A0M3I5W2_ASCLU